MIRYDGEYYDLIAETSDCTPIDWFVLLMGIALAGTGALGLLVVGWHLRQGWKDAAPP